MLWVVQTELVLLGASLARFFERLVLCCTLNITSAC